MKRPPDPGQERTEPLASAPDPLAAGDAALIGEAEATLAQVLADTGAVLDFARGCPACCFGPFPITALDAWRLRRGMAALAAADPERAQAVRERARSAVRTFAASFPGDARSGVLGDDDHAIEAFCGEFVAVACPALHPSTGRCELYASRPLICRAYGPPVRYGGQDLEPCALCFSGTAVVADACRAEIDAQGREDALVAAAEDVRGGIGDTVIAFVLAGAVE